MWKKKQRCCLTMPSLPHDVVEVILERLPVNTLLRFKSVSKQWKSTIQDPLFQERQLKQSGRGDPDILMVSVSPYDVCNFSVDSLRTLVLGSESSVKIPTPWEKDNTIYVASHGSCDGLVCLYNYEKSGFVVNPTTRWYSPLPLSGFQQLIIHLGLSYYEVGHETSRLGFGKDKINGTYKPVWLYNSFEIGLENATTCEVFDFSNNAWRYVTPSAPYRVVACPEPVYVDGSLHWFTECEETKVISFDLHTESFQVVSKAPFINVHPYYMVLCNLDNRLCVSEMKWPNQVIWSFNSDNKTWDKMFSIDLEVTFHWLGRPRCALSPLTLFDEGKKNKKKKKLLFHHRDLGRSLMVYNPETDSYRVAYDADSIGFPISYFKSLISIS